MRSTPLKLSSVISHQDVSEQFTFYFLKHFFMLTFLPEATASVAAMEATPLHIIHSIACYS
jgi:hypothetical protein